jgi:hypothetical protein
MGSGSPNDGFIRWLHRVLRFIGRHYMPILVSSVLTSVIGPVIVALISTHSGPAPSAQSLGPPEAVRPPTTPAAAERTPPSRGSVHPSPGDPIVPASEAHKHAGEKCTVELTVYNAASGRSGCIFLHSQASFKATDYFSVAITKEATEGFRAKKVEPLTAFTGSTLRVRGTIKLYEGRPEVWVDNVLQLEVVKPKAP